MAVNTRGPYSITKAFGPFIIAIKGRIALIGSVGILATKNASAYNMSKHAIEAFRRLPRRRDGAAGRTGKCHRACQLQYGTREKRCQAHWHVSCCRILRYTESLTKLLRQSNSRYSSHASPRRNDAIWSFQISMKPGERSAGRWSNSCSSMKDTASRMTGTRSSRCSTSGFHS